MPALTEPECTHLGNYDGYESPQACFDDFKPLMIAEGRRRRWSARSWRGVKVASVAMLLLANDELVIISDVNNSPKRGDPKDCAELGISRKVREYEAEAAGCWVVGICVVAPIKRSTIRSITGRIKSKLWPCLEPCLNELDANPAVTEETKMVGAGSTPDVPNEEKLFGELRAEHIQIPRPPRSEELFARHLLMHDALPETPIPNV